MCFDKWSLWRHERCGNLIWWDVWHWLRVVRYTDLGGGTAMVIENQIGKNWNREETIKAINKEVVMLNKHVQRLMYDIQIDMPRISDNALGMLRVRLEQAVREQEELWDVVHR